MMRVMAEKFERSVRLSRIFPFFSFIIIFTVLLKCWTRPGWSGSGINTQPKG